MMPDPLLIHAIFIIISVIKCYYDYNERFKNNI